MLYSQKKMKRQQSFSSSSIIRQNIQRMMEQYYCNIPRNQAYIDYNYSMVILHSNNSNKIDIILSCITASYTTLIKIVYKFMQLVLFICMDVQSILTQLNTILEALIIFYSAHSAKLKFCTRKMKMKIVWSMDIPNSPLASISLPLFILQGEEFDHAGFGQPKNSKIIKY